jgi:hypothetical protein
MFMGALSLNAALASPLVESKKLLVAIEGGGAVEVCPRTGAIVANFATGPNAFGATYSADGSRAFITVRRGCTSRILAPESLPHLTWM